MQSFASQAKEQADYAFNRIPDSHWNSLLGTGVDKDHFGQSLPCVTQADLSVMEHRYYPKRDERSCSDLEFALNRLLPDVESTAADAKRKINHQVAVFNREYGVSVIFAWMHGSRRHARTLLTRSRLSLIAVAPDGHAERPVSTFPLSSPVGNDLIPSKMGVDI
jgi:hypothetical protein